MENISLTGTEAVYLLRRSADNGQLPAGIEVVSQWVSGAESELARLTAALARAEATLRSSIATSETLDAMLVAQRSKTEKAESERDAAKAKLARAEECSVKTTEQLGVCERDVADLRESVAGLKRERVEIEAKLDAARREVERLNTEKAARDEWFNDLVRWGQSVAVQNFLHEYRNQCFQMTGMYDGAMSECCKEVCRKDVVFTTGLIEILGVQAAEAAQEGGA